MNLEPKKPDYLKNLGNNIRNALDETKGGFTMAEVIQEVIKAGVDVKDLVGMAGKVAEDINLAQEQEEQLNKFEEAA